MDHDFCPTRSAGEQRDRVRKDGSDRPRGGSGFPVVNLDVRARSSALT
jgi:hypothetical protein